MQLLLPALLALATTVPDDASDIRPLLIGQQIPDIALSDIDGKTVTLRALAAEKPIVLVFYRGGWCPYCSRQLSQLRAVEAPLLEIGYRIVAVSPDTPRHLRETADRGELRYTLLSDEALTAARKFGLAYKAKPEDFGSKAFHQAWRKRQGYGASQQEDMLPVPAVYLVSKRGRVVYQYVNIDFRVRLSGEVLLTAARAYGTGG